MRKAILTRDVGGAGTAQPASPTIPNACRFCCGPACGVVSLRINKPTLDWPPATELAEHAHDYPAQGSEAKPATPIVAPACRRVPGRYGAVQKRSYGRHLTLNRL